MCITSMVEVVGIHDGGPPGQSALHTLLLVFFGIPTWVGVWHAAFNFRTNFPECVSVSFLREPGVSPTSALRGLAEQGLVFIPLPANTVAVSERERLTPNVD